MSSYTDAQELLKTLSPRDKAALDRLLRDEMSAAWLPDPRNIPQVVAFESKADILFYGGQAGGGKTDLILGLALTKHRRSVIFREKYVDLRGIEERLLQMNGSRDGYNGQDMVLRRDGRVVELGALGLPGQEQNWQGRPHDLVAFDEGTQLDVQKVRFVSAWLRTEDPSQRCRIVIASNPPMGAAGYWVIEWFAPWLDPFFPNPAKAGELRWAITLSDGQIEWVDGPAIVKRGGEEYTPISRTFIPATLDDNPYLRDTNYRATLQSLPEPMRSKLLKGDFLAGRMDAEYQVIPSEWIREGQGRWGPAPPDGSAMMCIGLDIAQGGKDKTSLAPLHANWFAPLVVVDGIDTKDGKAVAAKIIMNRRDNALIVLDMTGGWGGSTKEHLQTNNIPVEGVVFNAKSEARTQDGSLKFYNRRSEMWWRFREALDPKSGEKIALPPDERLYSELTAPTWELKGDAILIESKDDIRKRLGSSTDRADAVILAWYGRKMAVTRQQISTGAAYSEAAAADDPLEEWL